LNFLQSKNKRAEDQIVVIIDEDNGTEEVKDYVEDFAHTYLDLENIKVYYHSLNKDFASHKNLLTCNAVMEIIFSQIDADEMPDENINKVFTRNFRIK
jgi:hypothetical protein